MTDLEYIRLSELENRSYHIKKLNERAFMGSIFDSTIKRMVINKTVRLNNNTLKREA